MVTIYNGNCLHELDLMDDNSVDAIVTDPPYGLSFMGKHWDYDVPDTKIWQQCLRVLKPGGHLLCFGGSRTYHRMAVNIEDAGFEIRDQIMWIYGSGFPKSLDVSKAIDKAAGAERQVIGQSNRHGGGKNFSSFGESLENNPRPAITAPATDEAAQWQGWGTALKPAHEPICLARKPFDSTVADNVLQYGTGAINIDGCRVEAEKATGWGGGGGGIWGSCTEGDSRPVDGRWPANIIHDGSDEVISAFPDAKGQLARARSDGSDSNNKVYSKLKNVNTAPDPRKDSGSAARFFYCAKASKQDRDEGLELLHIEKEIGHNRFDKCETCGGTILQNPSRPSACTCENPVRTPNKLKGNHHPTVKPTALMRYLCRLITPPGGTVLDPFAGSGSTGKAAILEGFNVILIEREAEYLPIIEARVKWAEEKLSLEQAKEDFKDVA